MGGMKTRKERKPLRQTTLDEFAGGDLLVGADAPGATVKPDPQQGDLFRPEARQLRFEMSAAPAAALHAVLVRPEIPHNTGAIGRTCVALGCDLALVRPLGFALSDEYVRRAGLDYWQHLKLAVYDNWDDYLARARPGRLVFLSTKGGRSLYDTVFQPGDTLVFGNESSGLPEPFYERYRDSLVRIPMPGPHTRSLNLANAASIALYEAYRQIV